MAPLSRLDRILFFLFFFNPTATTEIYTLSLHDALPISGSVFDDSGCFYRPENLGSSGFSLFCGVGSPSRDRKSTRLNSSHTVISYAVFCLKKKKIQKQTMSIVGWLYRIGSDIQEHRLRA